MQESKNKNGKSLEQRIMHEGPLAKDAGLWGSLVSAYSSSKTVKVGLTSVAAGYSASAILAMCLGVYLSFKTLGAVAKIVSKSATLRYFERRNFGQGFLYDLGSAYLTFGPNSRPTILGGTISAVTYFTGF